MTDEYYPGSKQKRVKFPEKPPVKPLYPEEIGEPAKYFRVKGQLTACYTLGQLASFLGRKAVTLRKWEASGVIPAAPFYIEGEDQRGNRRYYSAGHVEGIVAIAKEEGILQDAARKIGDTKFQPRVKELFDRIYKEMTA